jgi:hypothetical protein
MPNFLTGRHWSPADEAGRRRIAAQVDQLLPDQVRAPVEIYNPLPHVNAGDMEVESGNRQGAHARQRIA